MMMNLEEVHHVSSSWPALWSDPVGGLAFLMVVEMSVILKNQMSRKRG